MDYNKLSNNHLENFFFISRVNEKRDGLSFTVFDFKGRFWIEEYGFKDFTAIRESMGLECDYLQYFLTLKDALHMMKGGCRLRLEGGHATLQIKYQMTQGILLSGDFDLGKCID